MARPLCRLLESQPLNIGGGKSNANQPKRLLGLDLTGAQYGTCIPVVFGQNKVPGNVIWYGDFKAIPHKEKQGGKGGGGKSNTTYTYTSSFQIALCEGVASVIKTFDGTTTNSLAGAGGLGFTGTLGQAAWAHLSGGQALAYSGTAHADFQDLNLGSSASLPNLSFEVAARNQFGGGILDANPADIITAICSDAQVGIGFTALGSLTTLSNYASAAGIFFSPVYDQQQPAMRALDDMLKFANTAAWFSEGLLKFQPYGDTTISGNGATYTPVMTSVADLGPNDFITNGPGSAITIKRKSPADAQNMVRLDYKDRSANYRTITVQASIDQDLVSNGARALATESCDMITTAPTARLVTQNLLQRIFYVRNTYEFRLSWRWLHLEPMDIITLTDANTGLNLAPARIIEVSEDSHGLLTVIAEELPDGIGHAATYSTQSATATGQDTNADPGAVTAPFVFRAPGFLVSAGAPEIWVAVDAVSPLWGGCDVYISNNGGTSYSFLRTHNGGASYGKLTNTMAVQADLDSVSAPNVSLNGAAQLLGGSASDRDQFITLSLVDSELISYQTATLAAGPSYTLGSLRRGGYGTAIAAHAANAPFARIDENILRIPVDPSSIGSTVYLKFLSFNVFGQFGPRTLATETAYSYVIGTSVEFPDVPVTPSNFAVVPVADGVNIKWFNSNPAAVDCTSIEFATSPGGPFTVLGQAGPTGTNYHHAFNTGATYYYRARSRGDNISAGWSAYTSTLSSTGKTTAPSDGANLCPNPSFISNLVGTPSNTALAVGAMASDGWICSRIEAAYPADVTLKWVAGAARCTVGKPASVPNGTTVASIYQTLANVAVEPGKSYAIDFDVTQTYDSSLASGVTANSVMQISWFTAAGAYISASAQARYRGAPAPALLTVTAPATAASAAIYAYTTVVNSTGAAWTHGGATTLSSDFTRVSFYKHADIETAGSGVGIGDSRNLNQMMVTNGRSKLTTAITYTAAAGTPATATISSAAFTVTSGSVVVSYGAKSVAVTGTNSTTITYYLYLDDPAFVGTGTLVATTTGSDVYAADGRIYIGSTDVIYPATGSGSGTGSRDPSCVCTDMFLFDDFTAQESRQGVIIDCLNLPTGIEKFKRPIAHVRFAFTECVRITTDAGAMLDCSITAPFDLIDGGMTYAPEMLGESVVTDWGIEQVISVESIGVREVARINVGDVSYAAGHDPSHRIYSHNNLAPKP
jgi:hypothetical protein